MKRVVTVALALGTLSLAIGWLLIQPIQAQEELPTVTLYDFSRPAPLNGHGKYRVRIRTGGGPSLYHYVGLRVGSALSLNGSCSSDPALPERDRRLAENIVPMPLRLSELDAFREFAIYGCPSAIGSADSARTLEAQIWQSDTDTPPSSWTSPNPEHSDIVVLVVVPFPPSVLPLSETNAPLAAKKHLYLSALTLYRARDVERPRDPHGRASFEVASVTALNSVRPYVLYSLPGQEWKNAVLTLQHPLGRLVKGSLEGWPPDDTSIRDFPSPYGTFLYDYSALEAPPVDDNGVLRQPEIAGVQFLWTYDLAVPQVRHTDENAIHQDQLQGGLLLPLSMLVPDWPRFTKPSSVSFAGSDSHAHTTSYQSLESLCETESMEIDDLVIRPHRLSGTLTYTCGYLFNPNVPVTFAGLHDVEMQGIPINTHQRTIPSRMTSLYGTLNVCTARVSDDPAAIKCPDAPNYRFPLELKRQQSFTPPTPPNPNPPNSPWELRASFDIPLEPNSDLATDRFVHDVEMRVRIEHEFQVPYSTSGFSGFPSRVYRIDILDEDVLDIKRCEVERFPEEERTTCIAPKTIYQIDPPRWIMENDPQLPLSTFHPSLVTARTRYILRDDDGKTGFQVVPDHAIPDVATVNSHIVLYPETPPATTSPATDLAIVPPMPTTPELRLLSPDVSPGVEPGDTHVIRLAALYLDPAEIHTISIAVDGGSSRKIGLNPTCSSHSRFHTSVPNHPRYPSNVGSHSINIVTYVCDPNGPGSSDVVVSLLLRGNILDTTTITITPEPLPAPHVRIEVPTGPPPQGESIVLRVMVEDLNPAIPYRLVLRVPPGFSQGPGCGVLAKTVDIPPHATRHYVSITAEVCTDKASGSVVAILTQSGGPIATDTHSAGPADIPDDFIEEPGECVTKPLCPICPTCPTCPVCNP